MFIIVYKISKYPIDMLIIQIESKTNYTNYIRLIKCIIYLNIFL